MCFGPAGADGQQCFPHLAPDKISVRFFAETLAFLVLMIVLAAYY